MDTILAGKSRRLYKTLIPYKEGTMVCSVALQTAPLNVYPYTPGGSVFCPDEAGQFN